jgi:ADP-heptose:LPS heptosyltransferase
MTVGTSDAGGNAGRDAGSTGIPPSPGRDTADAVLVLRALGLGDALTGIPALRGIRRAWPDRFIVLAAPPASGRWLRDLGVVEEVLPTSGLADLSWPPAGWIGVGGHIAVNLHGRGPRSHRVLNATAPDRLVAFRSATGGHLTGPQWRQDEHEVARWCRLLSTVNGPCTEQDLRLPSGEPRQQHIVLHPGAASGSRRWPVDRWGQVAAELWRKGHRVAITGGPAERELCAAVVAAARSTSGFDGLEGTATAARRRPIQVLAGTLTFSDLADIVSTAGLLISGDTGVAHVATAFGTRSVLLFGPTPPGRWGPAIDQHLHTVLWHGDSGRSGDPHGHEVDPALAAITVEDVLTAVTGQLSAAGLPVASGHLPKLEVAETEQNTSPYAEARQAN